MFSWFLDLHLHLDWHCRAYLPGYFQLDGPEIPEAMRIYKIVAATNGGREAWEFPGRDVIILRPWTQIRPDTTRRRREHSMPGYKEHLPSRL
jgi:hypothetical protein